jgi:hypothetical protein
VREPGPTGIDESPTGSPAPLERVAAWLERRPLFVPVAAGIACSPLAFLGYGTDIDVGNVLRAADGLVGEGAYHISRGPGSFAYEAAVGVLDRIGGPVAVNLASLAMAVVMLAMLGRLLRRLGTPYASLLVAFVAANPYFVIAATSLGDFVWALALLLVGVDRFRHEMPILAGVVWALAIGCRASTVLLIAAFFGAVLLGRQRDLGAVLRAGVVAFGLGAAMFIPAWLSVGRSAAFLRNELEWGGLVLQRGRAVVKNVVLWGALGVAVLVAGIPKLVASARRWSSQELVRFALLGVVASELLFFRLPWKISHLLPVLVLCALLFGASPKMTARFAVLLVASQLIYGLIGFRFVVPDVPDQAQGSRLDAAVVAGPLLNDIRCRLDDLSWDGDGSADDRVARSEANWACTLASWRGPGELDPSERGS